MNQDDLRLLSATARRVLDYVEPPYETPDFARADAIAQTLGCSRPQVWGAVEEIRRVAGVAERVDAVMR